MISTFTAAARRLRKTLDSIPTPCSVKALGSARREPPRLPFEITFCDFKRATSSGVNRNAKSPGNRAGLRVAV
jgi:hypothetical protein